jgi:hypothetical protein
MITIMIINDVRSLYRSRRANHTITAGQQAKRWLTRRRLPTKFKM